MFPRGAFTSWLQSWLDETPAHTRKYAASAALKDALALLDEAPSKLHKFLPRDVDLSGELQQCFTDTLCFLKQRLIPALLRASGYRKPSSTLTTNDVLISFVL